MSNIAIKMFLGKNFVSSKNNKNFRYRHKFFYGKCSCSGFPTSDSMTLLYYWIKKNIALF